MTVLKTMNIRVPKELWIFLKNESMELEKPMNEIIVGMIERKKKNKEKRLTDSDAMVE